MAQANKAEFSPLQVESFNAIGGDIFLRWLFTDSRSSVVEHIIGMIESRCDIWWTEPIVIHAVVGSCGTKASWSIIKCPNFFFC